MSAPTTPGRWAIGMHWERLLFAHWPASPQTLRDRIPPGLHLDTFEGSAWIGIVPFRMARVGPAGLPLPGRLGNFGEINVRTYVRPVDAAAGPPGVWFLSLDAENPYVVAGGRALFHVPYARARISIEDAAGVIDYRSRRTHRDAPSARFRARYWRTGEFTRAATGSLDDWLTARYAVYAADRHARIFRGDIRHNAWRLAPAAWLLAGETLLSALRLSRPDEPPILRMADDVDVLAAWPQRVRG